MLPRLTATAICLGSWLGMASAQAAPHQQELLTIRSDQGCYRANQVPCKPDQMVPVMVTVSEHRSGQLATLSLIGMGEIARFPLAQLKETDGITLYSTTVQLAGRMEKRKILILKSSDYDPERGGTLSLEFARDERPVIGKPWGGLKLELARVGGQWHLEASDRRGTRRIQELTFTSNYQPVPGMGRQPVGIRKIEIR